MSVDGLRTNWVRTDFDIAAQQPYSIMHDNGDRKPYWLEDDTLVLGSIDTALQYVVAYPDGSIDIFDRETGEDKHLLYDNIFSFILDQAEKEDPKFDQQGRRFDADPGGKKGLFSKFNIISYLKN